jgi:hypothetical protein
MSSFDWYYRILIDGLISLIIILLVISPLALIIIRLKNALKSLERGEAPLARAFWHYGVIINLLLFVYFFGIAPFIKYGYALTNLLPSFFSPDFIDGFWVIVNIIFAPWPFLIFFYILYQYHVTIGVWRCASKYTGSSIWQESAKVTIALVAVSLPIISIFSFIVYNPFGY